MAVEVIVPSLGEVVEEVKILRWRKTEGDTIEKGEVLLEVESEKVNVEIESPASGIVGRILYPEGAKVPITFVVAVIINKGEPLPDKYLKVLSNEEPARKELESRKQITMDRIRVAPTAKKFAATKGIDISLVKPTGPHGTIMKKDVMTYLKTADQSAVISKTQSQFEKTVFGNASKVSKLAGRLAQEHEVPLKGIEGSGVRGRIMRSDVEKSVQEAKTPGLGKVIPMSTMRDVITQRMSKSAFTAPHIYFFTDIYMDPLLEFRKKIMIEFETKRSFRPSINDFLIKAVALNILDFPLLNARIKNQEIHIMQDVNVCIAIALSDGLMAPAVFNADCIGLFEIAKQRVDLVNRARSNQLTMEELEGGTFTISSLAQFDITHFTAIINPPQSGILSVGRTREELYMSDGSVCTRMIATFGLSVDHRIIDGTLAADFLQKLKKKLEKPMFTFRHF